MKKWIGLIAVLLAACATDFSSRSSGGGFQLRPYQEVTLANGLRLLLIPDRSLPRVGLHLMLNVGVLQESSSQAGLNRITANLLEQGTTNRSATQIAEELGQIAADFSVSAGDDATFLGSSTLATQKGKLLNLFADLVLNPAFSEGELERERNQTLAAIAHAQDNPSHFTDELAAHDFYGEHPYGRPALGLAKTVKQITRTDVVKFYFSFYRPNNAILAVTGDFDSSFVEQIKAAFEKWSAKEIGTKPELAQTFGDRKPIKLYTKEGLKQAQIRFFGPGIRRKDPDYLLLRIANVALGGDFVSRLNMRVRDQLGLTYSIQSHFDAKDNPGQFEISTFSRNEKIVDAIRESKLVFDAFVKNGITTEELEAAKALMAGQFPAAIETTEKLGFNLLLLRRYGISDQYLTQFNANLKAVRLDEVNAAIKRHLSSVPLQVVVYADQAAVLPQLKTLGDVSVEEIKSVSTSGKRKRQ